MPVSVHHVRGRTFARERPIDGLTGVARTPLILVEGQGEVVAHKRWQDLDPRLRQAILLGAAFECGLKVAALVDLARRPSREVHGSKAGWAAAITLINSAGLVPIVYLLRGRR